MTILKELGDGERMTIANGVPPETENEPLPGENRLLRKFVHLAAWIFLVSAPWLLLFLVAAVRNMPLLGGAPVWNDEVSIWRTLYSFSQCGFDVGSSGINEYTSAIGGFTAHGVGRILLYGGLALLFGVAENSVVLFNTLLMSLSLAFLVWKLRPGTLPSLALAAAYLGYAPLVLYAATSMSEISNYALLLCYVAFLVAFQRTGLRRNIAGAFIVALLLSFYRVNHIVLYIPLALSFCDYRLSKRMLFWMCAAMLAMIVTYFAVMQFSAPYPFGFLFMLTHARSITAAAGMVIKHSLQNVLTFFNIVSASAAEVVLRYSYFSVTIFCLFGGFLRRERTGGNLGFRLRRREAPDRIYMTAFLLLVLVLALVVGAYDVYGWRDYRSLAPVLWCAAAYLLLMRRRPAVFLASLGMLLMMAVTLLAWPPVFEQRLRPVASSEPAHQGLLALTGRMTVAERPSGRYENSVGVRDLTFELAGGLHPAFGLHIILPMRSGTAKQCRYILATGELEEIEGYEVVERNGYGVLFVRADGNQKKRSEDAAE